MDAKQIRFFLEIARTGSFTSAAKKLFISVPGLVKSMDKLEDELGAPLFVRQRTGVCLSPAGRALEQMAPAYLRQTERETVLCALNTSERAIRRMIRLPEALAGCKAVRDLMTGKTHNVQGGYVILALGACEGAVLGRAEA